MKKYKTLDEFLADQTPDRLEQINTVRTLLLDTEPALTENLKWNAPNYSYNGMDRVTFNLMNRQNKVMLALHMGTTKQENKNAKPVLARDEGIVEWRSDIRGTISFDNLLDIESKKASLKKVVASWLAI